MTLPTEKRKDQHDWGGTEEVGHRVEKVCVGESGVWLARIKVIGEIESNVHHLILHTMFSLREVLPPFLWTKICRHCNSYLPLIRLTNFLIRFGVLKV